MSRPFSPPIDQLGTYLVLSTAGIVVACLLSSGTASRREIASRIVTFPPLLALLLAFALAPVPVGLQLRLDRFAGNRLHLGLGLGFKLVLGPLLLALLYVGPLSRDGDITRVTLFEAAMGPQFGGAIVAMQDGLNPQLITLMVGIGITLSFLTLPVWYLGLGLI